MILFALIEERWLMNKLANKRTDILFEMGNDSGDEGRRWGQMGNGHIDRRAEGDKAIREEMQKAKRGRRRKQGKRGFHWY